MIWFYFMGAITLLYLCVYINYTYFKIFSSFIAIGLTYNIV